MSPERRRWLTRGAGVLALAVVLTALTAALSSRTSAGSTYSYGPLGWRGLRSAIEAQGLATADLDSWPRLGDAEPLPVDPSRDSLWISFPWQSGGLVDTRPLLEFVRAGGAVVIGYGEQGLDVALFDVLAELGLELEPRTSRASLLPWRWFDSQTPLEHALVTEGRPGAEGRPAVISGRSDWRLASWSEGHDRTLAHDAEKHPTILERPVARGRVILVPVSAFANAYLHNEGNATLLARLLPELGDRVVFDEIHHGIAGAGGTTTSDSAERLLDRVVLQLVAVYGLALLAFAWRFGPRWPTRAPAADSHRSYLVGLGALHRRLGHQGEAAELLVERLAVYSPSTYTPAVVSRLRATARRDGLLAAARAASGGQTHEHSHSDPEVQS